MNLVLQGPGAQAQHAAEVARLSGARACEQVSASAFRLRGATDNPGIRERCRELRLDAAFVPEGRTFASLRLVALDMDSTLVTVECIDELGELAGRKAEVAAITERAMRGQIDYSESLRRRVALLAGLPAEALDRVYRERLRLSPGAEALVAACRRHDVRVLLVSGGFTYFTDRLQQRLGIDYALSSALELGGGRLTGRLAGRVVDAEAKAERFREAARALGAAREQTVAVGDGANDLKMMALAGISVAYRAKPAVKAVATCTLDFAGLDGVVPLFE